MTRWFKWQRDCPRTRHDRHRGVVTHPDIGRIGSPGQSERPGSARTESASRNLHVASGGETRARYFAPTFRSQRELRYVGSRQRVPSLPGELKRELLWWGNPQFLRIRPTQLPNGSECGDNLARRERCDILSVGRTFAGAQRTSLLRRLHKFLSESGGCRTSVRAASRFFSRRPRSCIARFALTRNRSATHVPRSTTRPLARADAWAAAGMSGGCASPPPGPSQ